MVLLKISVLNALAGLASVASLATAAAVEADPMEGYTVVEATWEVEFKPGQTVALNGTVQQVHEQLLKLNPNYETEVMAPRLAAAALEPVQPLEKRDSTLCNLSRWGLAWSFRYQEGIDYLRGVGGRPSLPGGPSTCSRVSCSWSAAIYWCNDNPGPYTFESYNSIANAGATILYDCPSNIVFHLNGQRFHDDNVNVILRQDSC